MNLRIRPSVVALVVVIAALATTACGSAGRGNAGAGSHTTSRDSKEVTTAPEASTTAPQPTAAPRWETVTTFSGTGTLETPELSILDGAIQWRIRWTCESGTLRITLVPPPRRPGPVVDSPCPKSGTGFAIRTGSVHLGIEASGPWKATVDQQVDTVMNEPPPAGAAVTAMGDFYDVEKNGKGIARIYRLADGRRILRFEDFEVSSNTDLFIWLVNVAAPHTSAEAASAHRVVLGNLKSTVGNQNYEIPPEVSAPEMRSVVIWCEPLAIAYAAATLGA